MNHTYVIGDIHGAYLAVQQLISRIRPTDNDRLIFIGDYVDGWPESLKVITLMTELKTRYNCIFIRGNHDVELTKYLSGQPAKSDWYSHGGVGTMQEYEPARKKTKKTHLDFLTNDLRNYFIDENNRLYVHGGFTVIKGVLKEKYEENFYLDRTLWETARCMDKTLTPDNVLYPKRMLNYKEIYIGHTPSVNYGIFTPMWGGNVWNLDTGAGYTGPLSAINVDTKEVFQSDPVPSLYPGQEGRKLVK